jgi:hypothetical protein
MSKLLHVPSVGFGLLLAAVLACVIGAAASNHRSGPRYDASSLMGGLGLKIVDHETNTLYHYQRDVQDDAVTYKLYETLDLSMTGKAEIPAKRTDK